MASGRCRHTAAWLRNSLAQLVQQGLCRPAAEALAATTAEWLAEFERAQLILRLSPRLRSKHGD